MAELTGMSLSSWIRFERGERRATLEVWINAAWVLGVDLNDLVEREHWQWSPVPGYEEVPLEVVDDAWTAEHLTYDEVLERLAAFEADRAASTKH